MFLSVHVTFQCITVVNSLQHTLPWHAGLRRYSLIGLKYIDLSWNTPIYFSGYTVWAVTWCTGMWWVIQQQRHLLDSNTGYCSELAKDYLILRKNQHLETSRLLNLQNNTYRHFEIHKKYTNCMYKIKMYLCSIIKYLQYCMTHTINHILEKVYMLM